MYPFPRFGVHINPTYLHRLVGNQLKTFIMKKTSPPTFTGKWEYRMKKMFNFIYCKLIIDN